MAGGASKRDAANEKAPAMAEQTFSIVIRGGKVALP
jgi:hypothetical protein